MRYRFPPWLLLLLLVAICASVIGVVALRRSRLTTTAELMERLPTDEAAVVYVDFETLRRAGLLAMFSGSDMVQEPEYRAFVAGSGFDYLQDLDSALVSFHRDATYFLLRGRFNWKGLTKYVRDQGGACYNTLCRTAGSTPERNISFFPAASNIMALAVSKDPSAATQLLNRRKDAQAPAIPNEPLWSIIPSGLLKKNEGLLPGTRMFFRALENADRIVLSAGARGDRMELVLDATCRSEDDAAALVAQLQKTTALLQDLITREDRQPNPADISGLLTGGIFNQKGRRVFGRWPIERAFLESLAGSKL